MIESTLLMAVATLVAVRLFLPRVRDSRDWCATVTPLTSIVGNGVLLVAPPLYHAVNGWSELAMTYFNGGEYGHKHVHLLIARIPECAPARY